MDDLKKVGTGTKTPSGGGTEIATSVILNFQARLNDSSCVHGSILIVFIRILY